MAGRTLRAATGPQFDLELCQPTALRVVYGDWDGDNVAELIEAWQRGGTWLPVRDRTWLARGLPDLITRFPTHQSFAEATLPEILPPGRANAPFLEAAHLASMVFLNRGGRFEAVPLPLAAQVAPVFAVNVADFDGDGLEDLFLARIISGPPQIYPDDSGLGLWLRGTGSRFKASKARSGIHVPGNSGAALTDFDTTDAWTWRCPSTARDPSLCEPRWEAGLTFLARGRQATEDRRPDAAPVRRGRWGPVASFRVPVPDAGCLLPGAGDRTPTALWSAGRAAGATVPAPATGRVDFHHESPSWKARGFFTTEEPLASRRRRGP
jgi:hypothetical protein